MNHRSKNGEGRIVYQQRTMHSKVGESMPANSRQVPKVVTLVEPAIQPSISEATKTCCTLVHAASIADAARAAKDFKVQALILSPGVIAHERLPNIATLIGNCSGAMTIAVIAERQGGVEQGLLDLGGCGVRRAIDLSARDGWSSLRDFVSKVGDSTTIQILELVMPALAESSSESRQFIETLIRSAPTVGTVRAFARIVRVHPSSLMSRFFRAKLPAPKEYLSAARLLYAAAYFENSGVSVAKIADRLEYSSPQSFGRHIRTTMGMTAVRFRYRYSLQGMVDYFIKTLIIPHQGALGTFDPFGIRPQGRLRTVS